MSDQSNLKLHDKATRGVILTPEEEQQLEAWYAAQDIAEYETIQVTISRSRNETLMAQIDTITQRLPIVTRNIDKIARENAMLRREITRLQQQLTQTLALNPA